MSEKTVTVKFNLRVPLNDIEEKESMQEVLQLRRDIAKAEFEKKRVTEKFKEDINEKTGKFNLLLNEIDLGAHKTITCEKHYDFEDRTLTIYRTDTGDEILTRDLETDEYQENLDLDEAQKDDVDYFVNEEKQQKN